jgi:hypothetical protein
VEEDIEFVVDFVAKNFNNFFFLNWVWSENQLSVFTLGPTAQVTLI